MGSVFHKTITPQGPPNRGSGRRGKKQVGAGGAGRSGSKPRSSAGRAKRMSSGSSRPPTMRSTATPTTRSDRRPHRLPGRGDGAAVLAAAGADDGTGQGRRRHPRGGTPGPAHAGFDRGPHSGLLFDLDRQRGPSGQDRPVPGATEGHPGVARAWRISAATPSSSGWPARSTRGGPPGSATRTGSRPRACAPGWLTSNGWPSTRSPGCRSSTRRRTHGARDGLSRWTSSAGSRRPPGPRPSVRSARPGSKSLRPAQKLSGPERAELYLVLVGTGLRIGELTDILVRDMRLDGRMPHIDLPARLDKKRKAAHPAPS